MGELRTLARKPVSHYIKEATYRSAYGEDNKS